MFSDQSIVLAEFLSMMITAQKKITSRNFLLKVSLCASVLGAAGLMALPAHAVPSHSVDLVSDRSEIQADDQILWSSLGKIFNPFAPNVSDFLSSSFSATSTRGLKVDVEIPSAGGNITPPFVFQNNPPAQTNFAPQAYLLFTGFSPTIIPTGNSNPITIVFDKKVKAAGTQIAASGSQFINYQVFVSAFDDENRLLGTFSKQGISSGAADDSAVFMGVKSNNGAKIKKLVFWSNSPQRGIGINKVSINK